MDYRTRVDEIRAQLSVAKKAVQDGKVAVIAAKEFLDTTENARHITQQIGQAVQQEVHDRIAHVVSTCLESVFDESYEFKIIFEKKRNQTEARLIFIRDGLEINPLDASGGGIIDVAAFALRLACIMLRRPPIRRLLVLDEPYRFVSREYQPRVRGMLEKLSEKMDFQVIMVTHNTNLVTGKVVALG